MLTVQLGGAPTNLSESSPSCALQASTVTCSFDSLSAGSSTSVRISGAAPTKGAVTVSANARGSVDDPNSANDSASLSIAVH
jgi:hypothetical protein